MNIWIAALAAVLVQPLVLLVRMTPDYIASPGPLHGIGSMVIAVVIVAAAAVLLLGIPAFLLLQRLRRVNWISLASAGGLLGGLPAAFYWPRHLEGLSAGEPWHGTYVKTHVNGTPTIYAWLTYGENVLMFALHGLVGALAFYAVWRIRERRDKS